MNAFDILDNLLILEQSGRGIQEFFSVNQISNVIVYGLGRIGVRVVKSLNNAGINIVCVLDKDAANIDAEGLEVIEPLDVGDYDDQAELVIVSVSEGYYEIKEELEKKTKVDIISIGEIVEYCKEGEPDLGLKVIRRPSKHIEAVKSKKIDVENRSRKLLIFGGGSGIGKAIAYRMLMDGADVVIAGRSIDRLNKTRIDFEKALLNSNTGMIKAGTVYVLQADIACVNQQNIYFERAKKLMGGLDAFVNSAGITLEQRGRGYEPWDISEQEWDEISDTDFKGAYFLIRNEVDYLLKNSISGNILNIASNAAYTDVIGLYGAAKLSMIKWTRAFGKRFGHDGIVINGIAPGATFTSMISSYAKSMDQVYSRHAIDRFIKPEEIAELAWFCLGKNGVSLCGTTIVADGGDSSAI